MSSLLKKFQSRVTFSFSVMPCYIRNNCQSLTNSIIGAKKGAYIAISIHCSTVNLQDCRTMNIDVMYCQSQDDGGLGEPMN